MAIESAPEEGLQSNGPDGDAVSGVVGRRTWLMAGGAAVVGAGIAAVTAQPAAAQSGDPLILGDIDNTTDDETHLVMHDGTVPRALVVSRGWGTHLPDLTPSTGALVGLSKNTAPGVRGVSLGWNGVIGESTNVVGIVGRSQKDAGVLGESTNSIGVVGRGVSGAGVRGDSTDGNGVIGQSQNVVGAVGRSTADAGVLGESTNNIGVLGRSTNLTGVQGNGPAYGVRGNSAKTGVWGNSTGPSGVYAGVEGTSTNNWGVHGTSGTATGVAGQSTSGAGVSGIGGTYGGVFQGTRASVRLMPAATAGAPTGGTHEMGELLCDSAGALWFCQQAGTPGTWRKVKLV